MCPHCPLCRQWTAPCLQTYSWPQTATEPGCQPAPECLWCRPCALRSYQLQAKNKQTKKKGGGEMWMKKLRNKYTVTRGRGQVSPLATETVSLVIRFSAGITAEWGFMGGFVAFKIWVRIFCLTGRCPLTLAPLSISGYQCCLFLLGRENSLI